MALLALAAALVAAQDDAAETPLGDVARNLRKKTPASQEVIDNDNLTNVMDQVESQRASKSTLSTLKYSIDGAGKTFQVSSPDVTCSLSFTANAKALLSTQYVQMDLPASELAKLAGPAIIDGDSLQVSVFNGTDWHISEVAIALTVLKGSELRDQSSADSSEKYGSSKYGSASDGSLRDGSPSSDSMGRDVTKSAKSVPAAANVSAQESAKAAEKQPDVTTLYRVRAAAAPAETTIFSTPLNTEIGQDQEWHWAIVEAKGYPPQQSSGASAALVGQTPAQQALLESHPSNGPAR